MLNEGFSYKDLEGMLKATVHVDEFSSKMGEDDDVAVVSFFVRDLNAANDLVNWFEQGYDFVLDADRSPGEIKPNRYLVYVELKRRSTLAQHVAELLDDLSTLTEYTKPEDWLVVYKNNNFRFNQAQFEGTVPTSPRQYRKIQEEENNKMRTLAGLTPKSTYESDSAIRKFQDLANIKR